MFRRAGLHRRARRIHRGDPVTELAELTVDCAAPQAGLSRPSRSDPARRPHAQQIPTVKKMTTTTRGSIWRTSGRVLGRVRPMPNRYSAR